MELNRRAALRSLVGATASATLVSTAQAGTTKQSNEITEGRPDLKVLNNHDESVEFTVRISLNGKTRKSVDLQLPPNESYTVPRVNLPQTGVYTAEIEMGKEIVDSCQAEAPKDGFPPYLSIHADFREQDAFIVTSEA